MNSQCLSENSSGGRWILFVCNEFSGSQCEFPLCGNEFSCSQCEFILHRMNSFYERWILSWPIEFAMAEWEFILRLVRIHVLEDEFIGVAMNSLASILNSPESRTNSCNDRWIPLHLYEFTMNQCEFIWIKLGNLAFSQWIPLISMNSQWLVWIYPQPPRIHMMESKFRLNSPKGRMNSCCGKWIPLHIHVFTMSQCEFNQTDMQFSLWVSEFPTFSSIHTGWAWIPIQVLRVPSWSVKWIPQGFLRVLTMYFGEFSLWLSILCRFLVRFGFIYCNSL
jgi:hypothetical protein